jgi:hypothetical protein
VSPYQALVRRAWVDSPAPERLAAENRAEHSVLDPAPTARSIDLDFLVVAPAAASRDDERGIASAFHTQAGPAERRLRKRRARVGEVIERVADLRRDDEPWAGPIVVEAEAVGGDAPPEIAVVAWTNRRDAGQDGGDGSTACGDDGRIDRRVERVGRVGEVVELEDRRVCGEQPAERPPCQ